MTISAPKTPANRPENRPEFQGDIVALRIFNFTNVRSWNVIETKGQAILGLGTWEDIEKVSCTKCS